MTLHHRHIPAWVVTIIVTILVNAFFGVSLVEARDEPHKYTIEELLSTSFEPKDSGDLGMDPCKAGKL